MKNKFKIGDIVVSKSLWTNKEYEIKGINMIMGDAYEYHVWYENDVSYGYEHHFMSVE